MYRQTIQDRNEEWHKAHGSGTPQASGRARAGDVVIPKGFARIAG
jgi:hypothetical protein